MKAPALQVFSSVRACFAPVDRATGTPAPFDPATAATFNTAAPPEPWLSLGEVRAFRRTPSTAHTTLHAGPAGAVATQVRNHLGAQVDFDFLQWGKLQMALAGGCGQNNVLATTNSAPVAPIGVLAGSTAMQLNIASADAASFAPGDLLACDVHYAGQTGYVGSGISAAIVSPGQTADRDFIRRITFNVARVASITATGASGNNAPSTTLHLDQPLPGGAPAPNSFVQKITAFTDREGPSFFHEWSAIFFLATESGGNICFYYPRLQPAAPAFENAYSLAGNPGTLAHSSSDLHASSGEKGSTTKAAATAKSSIFKLPNHKLPNYKFSEGLALATLHASFIALPVTDATDNAPVICYRTYVPAPTASLY